MLCLLLDPIVGGAVVLRHFQTTPAVKTISRPRSRAAAREPYDSAKLRRSCRRPPGRACRPRPGR